MQKTSITKLVHIEEGLRDIDQICSKEKIEYRVIGSTAYTSAVGKIYRIPHDIDFLYDYSKKDILHQELIKKGYKQTHQKFPIPVLVRPLTHYVKGKKLLEPRGGEFTDRGFEFPLYFPMPILSKKFWPTIKLVFCKTMFLPVSYKFKKTRFIGLSTESLFLGLDVLMPIISSLNDKTSKRLLDHQMLQSKINLNKLEKIKNESPGLYYRKFPLATPNFLLVVKLASLIIHLKQH